MYFVCIVHVNHMYSHVFLMYFKYMRETYTIHVLYMCNTCIIHVKYMSKFANTCDLHVIYMRNT